MMTAARNEQTELYELANAQFEAALTPEQLARLEEMVLNSAELRQRYVAYMQLHGLARWLGWRGAWSALRDEATLSEAPPAAGPSAADRRSAAAPAVGAVRSSPLCLFGESHISVVGALASYAFAAIIFAIGVLAAWSWRAPGERGVVSVAQDAARPAAGDVARAPVVARVTRLVGNEWHGQIAVGEEVRSDQCLMVLHGLAEISYNSGATVTLEGPGAFSVDSANGGKLHQGKLTVRTPKAGDHPLFCVRSRTGVVTERGNCEFGLDVARSGASHVYVFRGHVEYHPPQRWAQSQILLLGNRDWLFAEGTVNGELRIDFIRGRKLPQEFVTQWFKGIAVASAEKGEKTSPKDGRATRNES